jgi:hypothetical protein
MSDGGREAGKAPGLWGVPGRPFFDPIPSPRGRIALARRAFPCAVRGWGLSGRRLPPLTGARAWPVIQKLSPAPIRAAGAPRGTQRRPTHALPLTQRPSAAPGSACPARRTPGASCSTPRTSSSSPPASSTSPPGASPCWRRTRRRGGRPCGWRWSAGGAPGHCRPVCGTSGGRMRAGYTAANWTCPLAPPNCAPWSGVEPRDGSETAGKASREFLLTAAPGGLDLLLRPRGTNLVGRQFRALAASFLAPAARWLLPVGATLRL